MFCFRHDYRSPCLNVINERSHASQKFNKKIQKCSSQNHYTKRQYFKTKKSNFKSESVLVYFQGHNVVCCAESTPVNVLHSTYRAVTHISEMPI